MPRIEKRGSKYVLLSEETGEVLGTHDMRAEAEAQERAIRARRNDARDGESVLRYDVRRLGRVRETAAGFLRIDATLTRTGILEYTQPDGSTRRELRRADDVFNQHSLDTMKGAPLIDSAGGMHSVGRVTPDNFQTTAVGHVGDDVRADGELMRATILVQDRETINRIKAGDRRELSAAYRAKMVHVPGEWNGQRYDAIQTAIVYNHVCLLPAGAGRAGPEVAMKLDAADAVSVDRADASGLGLFIQQQLELLKLSELELAKKAGLDEFRIQGILAGIDPTTDDELQRIATAIGSTLEALKKLIPQASRRDTKTTETSMNKVTLSIAGVDFEVEIADALAPDLNRRFKALGTDLTGQTERADAAEKTRDEQKEKLDAAEKKVEEISKPEFIQERIRARVKLETDAGHVLDEKAVPKLDSMTDLEIRQAVIAEAQPEFKLDGMEEPALVGLFDFITQQAEAKGEGDDKRGSGGTSRADARGGIHQGRQTPDKKPDDDDGEHKDSAAAKKAFTKRSRDAWKQPLAISKNPPAAS